jgi:hypothetical protein
MVKASPNCHINNRTSTEQKQNKPVPVTDDDEANERGVFIISQRACSAFSQSCCIQTPTGFLEEVNNCSALVKQLFCTGTILGSIVRKKKLIYFSDLFNYTGRIGITCSVRFSRLSVYKPD